MHQKQRRKNRKKINKRKNRQKIAIFSKCKQNVYDNILCNFSEAFQI